MRLSDLTRTLSLGLLVLALGLLSPSHVLGADKDKDEEDKDEQEQQTQRSAAKVAAQGNCTPGTASADLSVNNVRARIYNTGQLFYSKSESAQYMVPQKTGLASVFASGIWIGGYADDELRMAASTYAQSGEDFEFFPGPLDDSGEPADNCRSYDRVYSVSRKDVLAYEQSGETTADLRDWPVELGAPVIDGDGNPDNYNLSEGDRPEVLGDQTVWWVMNDMGGEHLTTLAQPIGLEVQGTAFSYQRADHLNNITFYKYKFIYKGDVTLRDVYLGLWVDPDLGNYTDDFVGSDTTLGLGYVYNGDDIDEGSEGYGSQPPALGYDFFQGPIIQADGVDNDKDGEIDEEGERMQMTHFVYYNNDQTNTGNPENAGDYYDYLRGRWKDGSRITFGGDGTGGNEPANFMFPGDPVTGEYWSEVNTDGQGSSNTPADRRFLMSTGPFTMEPGDTQEIVFGVVWAQGSDRLNSVTVLKNADQLAQSAFDVDFELPQPPDAPRVQVSTLDGMGILTWDYSEGQNNYLDSYDEFNRFVSGQGFEDTTYTFEGYKVYRYDSQQDQEGELIATYDRVNDITTVTDETFDPETGARISEVTAQGTDSGIQHRHIIRNLTNYQDYYYGIRAYAYNENSTPKILEGPETRVQVRPSKVSAREGGMRTVPADSIGADIMAAAPEDNQGDGIVAAEVVDPTSITGDTYRVEFYEWVNEDSTTSFTTYDLINETSGETILDGTTYAERTGKPMPQGENVQVVGGLSFTIKGPENGPLVMSNGNLAFVEHVGPGGTNPCEGAEVSETCSEVGGDGLWFSLNSTGEYFAYHLGSAGPEETIGGFAPDDFEIRFTEEGSYALHYFTQAGNGDTRIINVPFEVWNIGLTGAGNENDPSDDKQLIPWLYSDNGGECRFDLREALYADTYPVSDRIYAYPVDYPAFESYVDQNVQFNDCGGNGGTINIEEYIGFHDFSHGRPIQRFVLGDYVNVATEGADSVAAEALEGTVIRLYTTKPNQPGDEFTVNTADYRRETNQEDVAEANLEEMGIVPNPYRGASQYDVSATQDEVRFVNLPERATIRVFTLSGTLIRTLEKNSPETWLTWDLRTREDLPIASGMYLVHIEVPEVGERVLKFGVVKKRIQLDTF